MAQQKKNKLKLIPAVRLAKKAKNALILGAAAMSGKTVKGIADAMIGGAISGDTANKRKIKRKAKRRNLPNEESSRIRERMGSATTIPSEITAKFLNDKKSPNKMKKSPYKMKDFSGFGEGTSPAKQKYTLGSVTGDAQDDRQANKESQMSYTDEYANKALKQLGSDNKAIKSGKFNLSTDPDGKNKKGQDNYSDIQDRRYENKNVVRAYRDQQKNVKAGRDSLINPIKMKKKK